MEQRQIDHPDALLEKQHLLDTCEVIRYEIARMEQETGVGADEEREVAVPPDDTVDEWVAADIFRMKLDTLHRLARARHQAYFARLDFTPDGGDPTTWYLGRWGVVRSDTDEVAVLDWRAPAANLYYSGQVGPMDYDAPDGRVTGDLTLKRMLTVRDNQLLGMFDSGLVSQDEYLQGVLGAVSSDRLKEIVTTIQAEQNLVIRHPFSRSMIVQGVAGSGKTTIALHRIAWLLYDKRDTLRPEQLMILAPNPLFLSYVSQVLPDLGVERVVQTTFPGLCAKWMGKRSPKIRLLSRLEDKLSVSAEERAAAGAVLRRKGSLQYKASVEAYLEAFKRRMVPEGDLRFGNQVLYTQEELQDVLLRQLQHFPLADRIAEIRKYVKTRLKTAAQAMKEALGKMADDRLTQLLTAYPDSPERRARARKLLDSRDARMQEIDEREKTYLHDLPGLFPDLSPLTIYRDYLLSCEDSAVQQATLPYLDKGEVRGEDLAALVSITRVTHSLPGRALRHIVMDECQDFSPYQLAVLHEAYPAATFTLVGDLMQGVHEEEGTVDYAEWLEPVFGGKADVKLLETSYRNTVEIMSLAGRIAERHPVAGQMHPKPVLRHGEKPVLRIFAKDRDRMAALAAQAKAWRDEGYNTIALITRTQQEATKVYQALRKEIDVQLLHPDDRDYHAGVLVLPAAMVKGLEFDCVAVCDTSAAAFPDDPFLCRMLYVMSTRPLHRLAYFAAGSVSPLLAGLEDGMDA